MEKKKGLVHIYTGDGKGKTTAAAGLAVRMAGAGKRVLFVQFMKAPGSSELVSMEILGITVLNLCTSGKFIWNMTEEERNIYRKEQEGTLSAAIASAAGYDLVVLDEAISASATGMISLAELTVFLKEKPQGTELVLTGRDAPEALLSLSDYVSEIKAVKHPYDHGIMARRGIEF